MNWILIVAIVIWLYLLTVFKRAKMDFWYFTVGSAGLFIIGIILLQPVLLRPMQKVIAAATGVLGELTGMYTGYFDKGILFVANCSLVVDFECSGIIETFAFLALLWFFPAYHFHEKIVMSVVGILSVFSFNVLRIFVICLIMHWFGGGAFFVAHSIVGRLVFYVCTVALYYRVFTKAQVSRQKVGAFRYDTTE